METVEIITQNTSIYWFIAGSLFILLEAMAVPGIGFLFAGLSAITTGALIEFGLLPIDNYIIHFAIFLGASFAWAGILWKPIKHFQKRDKAAGFSNIIGDTAIVSGTLSKGNTGEVKWSGTIMQAVLIKNSNVEKLENGQQVKILEVQGNVLVVEPK